MSIFRFAFVETRSRFLLALLAAASLLMPITARAEQFRVVARGTITSVFDPDKILDGSVVVGSPFTFTFYYDTDAPRFSGPEGYGNYNLKGAAWGAIARYGSYTIIPSADSFNQAIIGDNIPLGHPDTPGPPLFDYFQLISDTGAVSSANARAKPLFRAQSNIQSADPSASALSSTSLPPLEAFGASAFTERRDFVSIMSGASSGFNPSASVQGRIESIRASPQTPTPAASLSIAPGSVFGGAAAFGTVMLIEPAPPGGMVVALSVSDAQIARAPASVAIAAGQTRATFSLATQPVRVNTRITVQASAGGVTRPASFVVSPPILKSLSLAPGSVYGGLSAKATATLSSPAPTGGIVLSLTTNTANAAVPATMTVPAGQTQAAFPVVTKAVSTQAQADIRASSGASVVHAYLGIAPPAFRAFALSPATIKGGQQNSVGTVALTSPAPAGGLSVALSSQTAARASVPASITIVAGATAATFTVTSKKVSMTGTTAITAIVRGVSKSVTLTVTP